MKQEWQPIETAPKNGRTIYCLFKGGKEYQVYYGDGEWMIPYIYNPERLGNPTHWMPLPEPPNAT